MSFPSWISVPHSTPSLSSRLSQSTGLSSLHHRVNFHGLSVSHRLMYMFLCYPLNLSHPLLWNSMDCVVQLCRSQRVGHTERLSLTHSFPALCPQVCSLCLHLHCYPANKFIHTTFLDSIFVLIYDTCLSLSDFLYFIRYNKL